tara:strand:+ start:538 stop:732 length:195 start_codon:yes stop_codon:yes gene_type:complete
MAADLTEYDIKFRAPALPLPSDEYNRDNAIKLNDSLRLYFMQIDEQFRKPTLKNQSDAQGWFLS